MSVAGRKYYVAVRDDYLVALEVDTAQLLGRNRDLNELHAHVQSIFPGSVYTPLDEERVQQYVALHSTLPSSLPSSAPSPTIAVLEQPSASNVYCSNCGSKNAQGGNFCWKCGARLATAVAVSPPPATN